MEPQRLSQAALKQTFASPKGELMFDRDNRHVWLTPGIGIARPDGQFDVVWRSKVPVRPDPYLAAARFEATRLRDGET